MTKTKRIIGMVLGILFIGLCVSFLRLSQFGVDPFSAMNLGISGFIGWSFGTWQLLVNAIILVVVFFQARSCIGAGTIINMVFVGYIADFICYVANDVVQFQMNLPLRIIALLLAQLMASMGVALYMVANMGIAPYDSVAIIIEKLTHQKIPFHKARVLSDVVVVIIGIIFAIASGAGIWSVVGIGTIINACFNGYFLAFLFEIFSVPKRGNIDYLFCGAGKCGLNHVRSGSVANRTMLFGNKHAVKRIGVG